MRGLRYLVRPEQPFSPEELAALFSLPGVRHKTNRIEVPWHLWGIVAQTFQMWGTRYQVSQTVRGRRVEPAFPERCTDPFAYVPGLGDDARRLATTFQQEGLAMFARLRGGVAAWPCGAGKTLLGLAFSLAFPGERSLVVCPSGTVGQWGSQYRRWSTVWPYLITTASHFEVRSTRQPKPLAVAALTPDGREWLRIERDRAIGRGRLDKARLRHSLLLLMGDHPYRLDRLDPEERKLVKALIRRERAVASEVEQPPLPEWTVVDGRGSVMARFDDKEEAKADRDQRSRDVRIPESAQVVVVGWSLLSKKLDALTAWAPSVVVVDESHRAKGTKRWVHHYDPETREESFTRLPNVSASAQAITQQAAAALLLTATPQPDRTRDWWGQLDLYDPFAFGPFHDWSVRYAAGHQGEYGWDSTGSSNETELQWRIGHFLHHVSKETTHAELPPLIRHVETLSLADLCSAKDALADAEMGSFGRGIQSKVAAEIALAAEMKREWMAKRIAGYLGEGAKIVVLTVLKSSAERLFQTIRGQSKVLGGKAGKAAMWLGHGGHTVAERQAIVDAYGPHPGPCVLVGTEAAWGESWDGLQFTDRAILGGLPWNHGMLIQLEGRFHRKGGDRSVIVEFPIASGTIDERIQQLVLQKLDAAVAVLPDAGVEKVGSDLRQEGQEEELLDGLATALLEGFSAQLADEDEGGWGDEDDEDEDD